MLNIKNIKIKSNKLKERVAEQFCPHIPQPVQPMKPVASPFPKKKEAAGVQPQKEETLLSWLAGSLKQGIKALPKMAGQLLSIQLGVVLAVNLLLWPLDTWKLPGPLASLAAAVIFLTATYNNVIPKRFTGSLCSPLGKGCFSK
ncbi:MAG: hypothetical protein QHH10_14120 [Peptococcaceae bacterium]|jgi:hypothetical protein|nr:hypothetical protein [Peptococcaceae bacterium]MDH7526432.1 hypothetical protein [Peptococcaceae bacterium]